MDIADDVKCGECSHLASAHADTADGDNNGACSMQGCDCGGMVAEGTEDSGDGDAAAARVTLAAELAEALLPGDAEFAASLATFVTEHASFRPLPDGMCVRTGCAHLTGAHLDLEDAPGGGKCLADGCQCTAYMPDGSPGEPQLPEPPLTAAADDGAPGEPGGEPVDEADAETPDDGFPYRALLVQEGVETIDGRFIQPYATKWRPPPLSLAYQDKTEHGGFADTAAINIGRIDSVVREPGEVDGTFDIWGIGVIDDDDENAIKAAHKIDGKFIVGVSVDLAIHAAEVEITAVDDDGWPIGERFIVTDCEIGMATVTPFPAFGECQIELTGERPGEAEVEAGIDLDLPEVGDRIPIIANATPAEVAELFAGWHPVEPTHLEERAEMTVTAAGGPIAPPREWFDPPSFAAEDLIEIPPHLCGGRRNVRACPLTITDDGRVFGHLASWHVNHTAMSGRSMRAPRNAGYDLFNSRGVVRCDDGADVPVGTITLDGGHAALNLDWQAAMAHYDDTRSAVIDCRVGADEFGVWIAGALRPDVDEMTLRRLRAASVSGDWRPLGSRHELVAACSCNVPGFPTLRTAVAASGAPDELVAMVAAGALPTRPEATPENLLAAATAELAASRRQREADRLIHQIG